MTLKARVQCTLEGARQVWEWAYLSGSDQGTTVSNSHCHYVSHQVLAGTTFSRLDGAVGSVKLAAALNKIIDGSVKGGPTSSRTSHVVVTSRFDGKRTTVQERECIYVTDATRCAAEMFQPPAIEARAKADSGQTSNMSFQGTLSKFRRRQGWPINP
ncbi:hypothetical protein BKA56DRAFT_623899 [Ilyonectria sp. MPI-CAGE-AT-0026]|nr:hypothetical protein BKA56DRAFT_623899 [Ilyonectria sp. MPI-CAGE-AT-0026]